ncbi:hypothetical protein ANANG_G00296740 [Anguilla anguilla]|uniref:Uncharacterized protein n=1 Tax=Anguilla anguilla TaxID=7936 RepID=A0A9D3LMD9_ANGAN|nr:hypothetical protein ANANG_G00296740 [Anguilla anguilla]
MDQHQDFLNSGLGGHALDSHALEYGSGEPVASAMVDLTLSDRDQGAELKKNGVSPTHLGPGNDLMKVARGPENDIVPSAPVTGEAKPAAGPERAAADKSAKVAPGPPLAGLQQYPPPAGGAPGWGLEKEKLAPPRHQEALNRSPKAPGKAPPPGGQTAASRPEHRKPGVGKADKELPKTPDRSGYSSPSTPKSPASRASAQASPPPRR